MIRLALIFFILGFAQFEIWGSGNEQQTASIFVEYFETWGSIVIEENSIEPYNKPIDSLSKAHIMSLLEKPSEKRLKRKIKELKGFIESLNTDTLNSLKLQWNQTKNNIIHNRLKYPIISLSMEDKLYAICQYWNTIRYFYPFFESIEEKWATEAESIVKKVLEDHSNQIYHIAIAELTALTSDGHAQIKSSFFDNYWGYFHLPVKINVVENRLYLTSPDLSCFGLSSDIKCPEIISINNQSFQDFYLENKKLIAGSNERTKVRLASSLFLRQQKQMECTLKVASGNKTVDIQINNQHLSNKELTDCETEFQKTASGPISKNIYYIDITSCPQEDFCNRMKSTKDFEALVLDLRGYPTVLLDDIANYLVTDTIKIAKWMHPDKDHIGDFIYGPDLTVSGDSKTPKYKGRVFLLVNNKTWSQAEFTALAIRNLPNAFTIGNYTSGTDGDISNIYLAGGIENQYTSLSILCLDGSPTYQIGIPIDFIVNPTERCNIHSDSELNACIKTIESFIARGD